MAGQTHLISIGIDWSQGKASSQAFLAELQSQIDALTAGGTAGTLTPGAIGSAGAQLKADIEYVVKLLRTAKIAVPPELTALTRGGLLKELQNIQFPKAGGGAAVGSSFATAAGNIAAKKALAGAGGAPDEERSEAQKQQDKAAATAALAADQEYIKWTVELAKQRQILSSEIDQAKAADQEYIEATVKAAQDRNILNASLEEEKATSADYLASVVLLATTRKNTAAAEAEVLAADRDYIVATVRAATERTLLEAAIEEEKAADREYIRATVKAAGDRETLTATVAEAKAADARLISSTLRTANARLESAANLDQAKAADSQFIANTVRAATEQLELASTIEEAKAANQRNIVATVRAATVKNEEAAVIAQAMAADNEYIASTVRLATERNFVAAEEASAKASDDLYLESTAKLAAERNFLAAAADEEKAASGEYIQSVVQAATEKNNLAASETEALAASTEAIEAEVRLTTARNELATSAADAYAADQLYITSTVESATSKLLQAAAENNALAASQEHLDAVLADALAKTNLTAIERETLVNSIQYNAALQRAKAALEQLSAVGKVTSGGNTNVNPAGGGSGGGGNKGFIGGLGSFGGEGGFLGGLGQRTASLAASFGSGLAIFAVINSIRDSIKEAEQLQVQLAIIKSQLASTGDEGGAAFQKISDGIIDVAKNTATTADIVAQTTRKLAGVFADDQGKPNFDKALSEGQDAFKLAKVTGLPTEEITNDLVAISTAFNVNFKDIGDLAIGLGQDFGQSESDIIKFTSALAPTAQELGFTATQLAGLGAVAEEFSGQSASSLAENFRRILPALQQQRAKIVGLFDDSGHADIGQSIAESFGSGNIEQVLEKIIGGYGRLNDQEKQLLVSMAGGRREAGALYSVLEHGDATLKALGTDGGKYAGDLDKRFSEIQKTVSFAFQEMKVAIETFGVALFQSGLGDALVELAGVGTQLFNVASQLLGVFSSFNDLMGGIPAKIAVVTGAVLLLSKALALMGVQKGLGANGLGGLFGFGAAVPLAVALGGALLVHQGQSDDAKKDVSDGRALFDTKIDTALSQGVTPDQIRQQIKSTGTSGDLSGLQTVQNFLNGASTDDPSTIAYQELEKKDAARRTAGLQAIQNFYDARAKKAIEDFNKGNHTQQQKDDFAKRQNQIPDDFKKGFEAYQKDPGGNVDFANQQFNAAAFADNPIHDILNNAIKQFEERAKTAAKVVDLQKQAADDVGKTANAKQQYEQGSGTLSGYIAALNQELLHWQQIASASENDVEAQQKVQQATAAIQAEIKKAAEATATADIRVGTLTGTDTPKRNIQIQQNKVDTLAANPQSNPADVTNARLDLAQSEQDAFKQEISLARTAGEKLAIINRGFKFSDQARLGLAQAEVETASNKEALVQVAAIVGGTLQTVEKQVEEAMIQFGEDGNTILRGIIEARIAYLKIATKVAQDSQNFLGAALGAALTKQSEEALYNLNSAPIDAPPVPEAGGVSAADKAAAEKAAAEESRTNAIAEANARLDIEAAQANGDAIKLAQIAQERAQIDLSYQRSEGERLAAIAKMVEADNQLAKAMADYRKALRGFAVAQSNNDPVVAATYALAQAEDDLARASGDTEITNSMTAVLNAKHNLARSLQDQADAFTNVDIARANAGGDPVKAAQLRVKELYERLANAAAEGLNPTEIANLQAQIIDATANLASTQISHAEQMIQNQLTLGKINKSQAVAQLQALKAFAKTQEEIDQIDIEIKNLTNSQSDYKFNIPGVIDLPNIYEVRRLGQSGGAGSYQDNRTVNINLYASNQVDLQPAIDVILSSVQAPPRNGQRLGNY